MSQPPTIDSPTTNPPYHIQDSDDDETTLPFAAPLPREPFLAPDFTPTAYLSTLSNRHQSLSDLRAELRNRSTLLSRELLDLVNTHYADFLTLGNSLVGGEERIEGVRVGLLGFGKEVRGLEGVVAEREEEVRRLVEERRGVRGELELGRRLVGIEEGLRVCERGVGVGGAEVEDGGQSSDSSEDEDEDEDDSTYGTSISRLRSNVVQYRLVKEGMKGLEEHPFVVSLAPRLAKVRSTLLLDLSTALQQAKGRGADGAGRVMQILGVYKDMEEQAEAVRVLKGMKN